ncbi:cilia- and flagella-associated protein 97-like [Osmia bicornis bicornis]|uniref:cilia- and flagella-associated protein 97-like n=1 Tax=Osmia bicornis bicornis TaxID=1437191 RepID=UPI0010F977F9|nr:cilia- and flagella-associated protein 97-like [Osmia bicornis bicornis]
MMSCLQNHEINCECQYTLTFMDNVVEKTFSEIKDSFTRVPSIHEVDEEDTDEEHTSEHESETCKDVQQITDITEAVDEDSIYSNESFCSDESCDESEGTNVSPRSLNDSHFSSQINDSKCDKDDNEDKDKQSESVTQNSDINLTCKNSICEDGSIALKQAKSKRKNMSFTDDELRKIEWENQLLLKKIMAQQRPKDKVFHENIQQPRVSSSAINRRKLQRKIENENILLLQRIQQAKSCVTNTMTKPGYRQTIL